MFVFDLNSFHKAIRQEEAGERPEPHLNRCFKNKNHFVEICCNTAITASPSHLFIFYFFFKFSLEFFLSA